MTKTRMEVYGGRNLMTPTLADVEQVAPGVGRMTCIECNGDPERYAAAFGDQSAKLAANGCVDCKNRGWVYVSA